MGIFSSPMGALGPTGKNSSQDLQGRKGKGWTAPKTVKIAVNGKCSHQWGGGLTPYLKSSSYASLRQATPTGAIWWKGQSKMSGVWRKTKFSRGKQFYEKSKNKTHCARTRLWHKGNSTVPGALSTPARISNDQNSLRRAASLPLRGPWAEKAQPGH